MLAMSLAWTQDPCLADVQQMVRGSRCTRLFGYRQNNLTNLDALWKNQL